MLVKKPKITLLHFVFNKNIQPTNVQNIFLSFKLKFLNVFVFFALEWRFKSILKRLKSGPLQGPVTFDDF